MSKETKNKNLINLVNVATADPMDAPFVNDKDRIRYVSNITKDMSIVEAFAKCYGFKVTDEAKEKHETNTVTVVHVGQLYLGRVKTLEKNVLTFEIPGVKEELVAIENFNSCIDELRNYLLTHDNMLMFEAREKRQDKFMVSVCNGYYRYWMKLLEDKIQKEQPVDVHIDELVKGGYMAHIDIDPLCEITGKSYTNSVFIPGSQIVLNIEKDFEKWIDQDIQMIPQKVVDFKKDFKTGAIEKSIVGSRKRLLQIDGMQNLYDIWNKKRLAEKNTNVTYVNPTLNGHVTGIINSNNNHGVFVEIDDMNITGLLPLEPKKLLDWHPGDLIDVKIKEFEVKEGKDAFVTSRKGKVIKCNTRPVFELA